MPPLMFCRYSFHFHFLHYLLIAAIATPITPLPFSSARQATPFLIFSAMPALFFAADYAIIFAAIAFIISSPPLSPLRCHCRRH